MLATKVYKYKTKQNTVSVFKGHKIQSGILICMNVTLVHSTNKYEEWAFSVNFYRKKTQHEKHKSVQDPGWKAGRSGTRMRLDMKFGTRE